MVSTTNERPPEPRPGMEKAVEMGAGLVNAGAAAMTAVLSQASGLTPEACENAEKLLARVQEMFCGMSSHVSGLIDKLAALNGAHPGALPQNPIDPVKAMEQIARGVRRAEEVLNGQNLVVANGSVELEFYAEIPGSSTGARTRLVFDITPKPDA